MADTLAAIVRTGLLLSVMTATASQGLELTPGQQLAFFKERPAMMLRSIAVVLVLVPLTTLAVLFLMTPSRPVVIGLVILAASPAAPFQLLNIRKKGGSLVYVGTMHVSLGILAVVTVPSVLFLLSEAFGFEAEVSVSQVARTVGVTILLPMILGMLIRSFLPKAADRMAPMLARSAEILFGSIVLIILVRNSGLLLRMDLGSYFTMAVFILVNLSLGHVLGPPDPQERTTLAMESGARNFGLAMMIGALNFSQERAMVVLVPYTVLFVVVSMCYLKWRERAS